MQALKVLAKGFELGARFFDESCQELDLDELVGDCVEVGEVDGHGLDVDANGS